jgi:lipopolysaccharide transport system ATP-binding protein
MVSRICNQIILLDKGQSKFQGVEVPKAIDLYYTRFSNNESNVVFDDGSITLTHISLSNSGSFVENIPQLFWKDDFILELKFNSKVENLNLQYIIILIDKEQRPVASFERNKESDNIVSINGVINFTITHLKLQLSKGVYSINVAVRNMKTKEPVYRSNSVYDFQVIHQEEIWEPMLLEASYNSI